MLKIHCQTNSPFANIMETIEETAETFCQVSADCKVISGRTRTANQSDLFQNVFPIIDQYLDSCSKLHSDLKIVSLSLGNFFQSLEQLSSHIADTKGKKFKRFFFFFAKRSDCDQATAELLERTYFISTRITSLLSRNFRQ